MDRQQMGHAVTARLHRPPRAVSDIWIARMRELVAEHQVHWELWPEYDLDGQGRRISAGFELILLGLHEEPGHDPSDTCDRCEQILRDLKEIAFSIMPDDDPRDIFEILPRRIMRIGRARGPRAEVGVGVRVLSRQRPVAAIRGMPALRTLESSLRELGAQKDRWRSC